jgi:hypothetical protein
MPARVIRVVLTGGRQLPVFPNKQTFSVFAGMSQTCQEATSLDHFIRLYQHIRWNRQTESRRCFQAHLF